MNPFFSSARIRRLENFLRGIVDKLCARLGQFENTGVPVIIQHAYSCFATDVLSDYVQRRIYLDERNFIPQ
jgi:hypothetical protein